MIAFSGSKIVDSLLHKKMESFTSYTITDKEPLSAR